TPASAACSASPSASLSLPSTPDPPTLRMSSSFTVNASLAATGAVFAVAAAVKLQVGPVVVVLPSLTVAYHSYCAPRVSPAKAAVVFDPETTFELVAIAVNGEPFML